MKKGDSVASTVSNMFGVISSMEGEHNAMIKVGEKEIYADLKFWRVVPKKRRRQNGQKKTEQSVQ